MTFANPVHKILHYEESPHRCPVCQRSFNQRSNLKTHLLTHTDIKPKQLLELAERLEAASGHKPTCSTRGLHSCPSDDIADDEVIDVVCDNEEVSDNLKKLLLARSQVGRGLPKLERCHSFSIDELMRK